jgi:hypothetical protein
MSLGISTVNGPLSVITRIKEEGNWPRAVVMLAIYLEKHSYLAVKEHFAPLKNAVDKRSLERLHLTHYGLVLLAAGRITPDEYITIRGINKVRNSWMHREEKKYQIGTKGKREYLPLLEKGEHLLRKLFAPRVYVSKR